MAEYAPDQVDISIGKTISWADTIDGEYTLITATKKITIPGELGVVDGTTDQSPDLHEESVIGLYKAGVASFSYEYTPEQWEELEEIFMLASDRETRPDAKKYWKVTNAIGGVWKFRGFITKHPMPMDDPAAIPMIEVEIQAIGKTTFSVEVGS